jgi:hypothetical protein
MPVNIDHSTAGLTTIAAPSSGTATITLPAATGTLVYADTNNNATIGGTYVMGSSFLRNRIINGNMYVAQRATSATVTAGTAVPTASTGYPCVDRFFVYSTGANVTAAQVAGAGANKNLLQITGAASVTAVGIGQRIEQLNSYDLAGQTCTLSVNIANSVLTTVTWTASYATTADTFGTIGTPTKTQIATGTFTVNSTLTRYTTNISVPAAATTGIEILFTVGAQTSGTWSIGNVQFEAGSIATPFERPSYTDQLARCQRYYYAVGLSFMTIIATSNGSAMQWRAALPVYIRTAATVIHALTNANYTATSSAAPVNGWGFAQQYITWIGKTGTLANIVPYAEENCLIFQLSGATFSAQPQYLSAVGISSVAQICVEL